MSISYKISAKKDSKGSTEVLILKQGLRDFNENIFGDELSFDKVYRGEEKITDKQILRLLKYSVDPREKELPKPYPLTLCFFLNLFYLALAQLFVLLQQ